MDLEVSEPIDFSSGDHQHLVRKAADPYTGASLLGPMELHLQLRSHDKLMEIHTQELTGEQIPMWYRFHQRLLQTTTTLAHFQKQLSAEVRIKKWPFWKRTAKVLLKYFHRVGCRI